MCNFLNLLFIDKIILKYYIEIIIFMSEYSVCCQKFIKKQRLFMLRKARFNKNLTQKDLATYLGVSQSYISKLETRKTKSVSVKMILNMSAILEVNPIDLFLFIAELPPKGK